MKLALRRTAEPGATAIQKLGCDIIKARLVSQFCHGGIVVDDSLLHATSSRGLHKLSRTQWSPDGWLLLDCGDGADQRVLDLFDRHQGMKYDWFSLLAFVGFRASDIKRLYCFEWCWWAMTGHAPSQRITPEMLILESMK
jgi:hypothetical protein